MNAFITVSSSHKLRIPRMIACFVEDCANCKFYTRGGDLISYLITQHHIAKEEAKSIAHHLKLILETYPERIVAGPGDIENSQPNEEERKIIKSFHLLPYKKHIQDNKIEINDLIPSSQ